MFNEYHNLFHKSLIEGLTWWFKPFAFLNHSEINIQLFQIFITFLLFSKFQLKSHIWEQWATHSEGMVSEEPEPDVLKHSRTRLATTNPRLLPQAYVKQG